MNKIAANKFQLGDYFVSAVNTGCSSIYTWCPSGKPLEFYKILTAVTLNANNTAPSECLAVQRAPTSSSQLDGTVLKQLSCTTPIKYFICMSK
jgi:hypothetical protein